MTRAAAPCLLVALSCALGCATPPFDFGKNGPKNDGEPTNSLPYYSETYRPQVHFTPATNWTNDVNGAVYYNGVYHLFYQHNPLGLGFGNVSWGHATSTDLLHWNHRSVALWEDSPTASNIWSGTAAVDTNDDAGFCAGEGNCTAMLAFYTDANNTQKQALAHSVDGGNTWVKDGVIIPNTTPNNRDIKAFYYAPGTHWNALVTRENGYEIYTSTDLKAWTSTQQYTAPAANVWECMDLFTLKDTVTGITKWVMVHDEAGLVHYTVGDFNGAIYTPSSAADGIVDYSNEYYAAITYNVDGSTETRRINMGWMRDPAPQSALTPTWTNGHTIPRQFTLVNGVLHSAPIAELATLYDDSATFNANNFTLSPNDTQLAALNLDVADATITGGVYGADQVGWVVRSDGTHFAQVYFNANSNTMVIDRTNVMGNWNAGGATVLTAPVTLDANHDFSLRMVLDRNSIELFDLIGGASLTAYIYPPSTAHGMQLLAVGGSAAVSRAEVHGLKSVWPRTSDANIPLANWVPASGSWASTDEGMVGIAQGADVFTISRAQIANDLIYEADVTPLNGAGALVFRSTLGGETCYGVTLDAVSGRAKIIKWHDGKPTEMLTADISTVFPPTPRHVKVDVKGPSITVYLDGSATPIMQVTDTKPLNAGYVGLNTSGNEAIFNNLSLTVL